MPAALPQSLAPTDIQGGSSTPACEKQGSEIRANCKLYLVTVLRDGGVTQGEDTNRNVVAGAPILLQSITGLVFPHYQVQNV